MILTNKQIEDAVRRSDLVINPFDEKLVEAATYDLRVGTQGVTTTSKRVIDIREHGFLIIEPGDFAVVITLEELRLSPQYAARFGLRSKYARKGLIATTGAQIDPGYHGRLVVGLTNLSPKPITLAHKDTFVSVEFHRLEEASTKTYCGPFQDRMELGADDIAFITETEGLAFSEVLTTLRSLSSNVAVLAREVRAMEWAVGIAVGVLALLVAIVTLVATFKH